MDLYDLLELGLLDRQIMDWKEKYYSEIDKFKMKQSDRLNFREMVEDRDFRRAIFKDLTENFNKEHKEGCEPKQSFVYEIIGKRGRGKTTLMKIIMNNTREYHPNIETNVLYNIQKILEKMKEIGFDYPHSVFGSDEPLKLSGEGKIIAQEALENVIQICREFSFNFIFNVKKFTFVENVDDYLLLFGYNTQSQKTRCLWLSDKGKPMGIVYFTKNFTEEQHKEDTKIKKEKFLNLLNNLGRDGVYNLDEEKSKCMEYLQDKTSDIDKLSDVKFFLYDKFKYPRNILLMISNQVFKEIQSSQKSTLKKEKLFLSNPLDVSVKDFKLIDITKFDDRYIQKAIDICEITNKQKELLQLKLIEKIGSKQLIKVLHTKEFSQNFHIYNFLKQISPELGLKMELAFYDFMTYHKNDFEYFGGRIHSLDFINHTNKQVIELKTVYKEKDRLNHIYDLNLEEFEKSKELKYDLVYSVIILELKEVYTYLYNKSGENNG